MGESSGNPRGSVDSTAGLRTPPTTDAVLKAVSECAVDLASVGDRELVLSGIIRRTKQLLGADMSYLSLNDLSKGQTYIHLTDGVRTQAYRTIRMPLGTGVLGAVAAGGATVQTLDYLHDVDLNHLDGIDRIVREEGVKTIVGTPLYVGGRVVGALLVAMRTRAYFPDAALRVLEHMSVQATIALEQWRLNGEIARLDAALRETESGAASRLRDLEAIIRMDEQLTGSLLTPAGTGGVLDALSDELKAAVGLHDPRGRLIDGAEVVEPSAWGSWEITAAIQTSATQAKAIGASHNGVECSLATVAAGEEHLATLVVAGHLDRIS